MHRPLWLVCLVCLGCQQSPIFRLVTAPASSNLWHEGQKAVRQGEPEKAIALYRQSLRADESRTHNHLSLAAAYLQQGDEAKACLHLGLFLQGQPDHRGARFYYAELLSRQNQPTLARVQFQLAVAILQEEPALDWQELIHCHGRLLELAEAQEDAYDASLNRGIGLYLLAMQHTKTHDPEETISTESLLCKAADELTQAHLLQPGEARACWYLFSVMRQLSQQPQARRWLRQTQVLAPFSQLTSAERRRLDMSITN